MKINIKDFTFLIPIRIDSLVRVENLLLSIQHILKYFDTNIIVLQASDYDNGILTKLLNKKVKYIFYEDRDAVFYRTKYLNIMTKLSTTPYIGIYDTDVIIPKEQIFDSIQRLREGTEIAYPYDGHFLDTSDILRELYFKKKNINLLLKNRNKMSLIYGNQMKGGAIFVNKIAYINAGMENEKFYGWAPEDWERYERLKNFGYKIHCSTGCLFHLSHPRGTNSTYRSTDQVINTNTELVHTRNSSKEEILSVLSEPKLNSI